MQGAQNAKFSILTLAQAASPASLPGHIIPDFDI
jgi:hypothetical protein